MIKAAAYVIWQWTWGILQSLSGLVLLIMYRRDKHYWYHGALVTLWENRSSVSLGMFVFVTKEPYFCSMLQNGHSEAELSQRLLVHEYGHTIQSLISGPLYLIIIGIPSFLWAGLPFLSRYRHNKCVSYFSFFTEKWANHLGELVTGEKSMENLIID